MSSSSRLADDYHEESYRWRRSTNGETSSRWSKVGDERREAKKFPPPLSSLNIHGQPRFFLLPERKDGRLELTEVRIQRQDILRATRQDGRLRLLLLRDPQEEEQEEEEEVEDETGVEERQELTQVQENGEEEEIEEEEKCVKRQGVGVEVQEEGDDEVAVVEEVTDEEEKGGGEWIFPVTRCNELVNHPQHHPYIAATN